MILLVISSIICLQAYEIDVNTFSNYLDVQNRHLHLEWLLNMDKKYINATSSYSFQVVGRQINKISLDIYKLNIYSTYLKNGVLLPHTIDSPYADSDQGQRLNIQLDRTYYRGEYVELSIKYSIDSKSRAISFMTKEQTSTKTMPYLFSQCEDANCRALAPLQDTPAIKQTYTATIIYKDTEAKDVFMSADESKEQFKILNKPQDEATFTWKYKYFIQKVPIPSYLIAIVAGNIQKVPTSTGGRTFLVSEPDKLAAYTEELKEMEQFLLAIEQYIGPYTWGTYTLVIQPPSFPIGGMENPLLTFANPSIMTGTGSGLAVTIHEMAHSWFGNTITCVNWANMWINEGFTVFLERKASLIHYNIPDDIKLNAIIGNTSMYQDMLGYGLESNFSSLHPDTTGLNPDDSFSEIPYEKGYQFLNYLESIVGEQDFKMMLRAYLAQYKYQSIDQQEFQNFLLRYLQEQGVDDYSTKRYKILENWNRWVYSPGLPPVFVDFSTNKLTQALDYSNAYITADGKQPTNWQDYKTFLHSQKQIFLEDLFKKAENNQLKLTVVEQIDKDLKLTQENDFELKFRWFRAILTAGDKNRFMQIADFLGAVGRGKMVYPVYRALNKLDHDFAVQTFRSHETFYHPIARNNIINILGLKDSFIQ
ncbi:unnamed protein product (macronuclear) [Paramecium tetraurelia]|uniref:Peptidase M1 leukotriene A4 hydrolase/aminopeptidase C-terminal domain-containing protein n=1 Tax=Paramecium tetraurelia TaxID=5888 RepID=A0CB40_PARTE|nr:uncharacterized protein GSPATT00036790001 [Paramecium tetraurelia]CAK68007.1 unnamed protein product [Paramecium tetraurelia]|eukprot:XP_001435404.1 hypothetical protein (macronuclear) [Paramecium tetraurelia strain d4-2]